MSQSLSDILLHIVFSTKNRAPLIHPNIEESLYRYLKGIGQNINCPILAINGTEDHIHLLICLSKTVSVSKLILDLKTNSSKWIKTQHIDCKDFSWQKGYAAFSVSRSNIEKVLAYISNQKEHHKKTSFKEEFLALLKRANVSYDERYLWD